MNHPDGNFLPMDEEYLAWLDEVAEFFRSAALAMEERA